MKNFNKIIAIIAIALLCSTMNYAASKVVSTVPISPAIDNSGVKYVKVIIKLTDKFVANDMGIILHQNAVLDFPGSYWNEGIGILGVWKTASGAQLRGYNGTGSAWDTENIKDFSIGDQIAIWLKIDIANNTCSIITQTEGEAATAAVTGDYINRASIQSVPAADQINYCTVFYNDKDNLNTDGCVEVIQDAAIVPSVVAHTFTTDIPGATQAETVSVYPTLVENNVTIASESEISVVKVYSLTGQQVLTLNNQEVISLSSLSAGAYVVEIECVSGDVVRKKVIKK